MDKIYDITHNPDRELRADQCEVGLRFMIDLVKQLGARSYIEIGCAKLLTFSVFQDALLKPSYSVGVDIKSYTEWQNYDTTEETYLFDGGSSEPTVVGKVREALNGRLVDVLFIDGDHNEEFVQADWDNFSPFVRSGGLILFHDWDPPSVARGDLGGQGAAIVCNRLAAEGYTIHNVPVTFIGTSYLYKK